MRTCGRCHEDKPIEDFQRGVGGRLYSYCRSCRKAYQQENMHNPEFQRKYRDRMLRNKFGITIEDYERMLEEQDGVCAICGCTPGKRLFAVDHCHDTDRIRRLLCSNCNTGLGMFQDDPDLLMAAAAYLLQNETAVPIV
jgi:hypothetical protein